MTDQAVATSFTPGPWTAVDSAIEADSPDRPGFTDVIAWVSNDVDESTSRANARLIAAAPDLLAALSHLLGVCETAWCIDEEEEGPNPDLAIARAAIAKAEGRES